jgi:hypothetical protein
MSGVIMAPVVYAVRPGDTNEELRYSLRSLANLDHDRVIIAGHCPPWVRNVEHLPVHAVGSKYDRTAANWRAACEHLDEPFLMFNDDFFVMRPTTVETWHRGPLADVIAYYESIGSRQYLAGMRNTARLLDLLGIDEPLSYGLHVPMWIDPRLWLRMLEQVGDHDGPLHWRTVYGNLWRVGGVRRDDVKVHGRRSTWGTGGDFLSTSDTTFAAHDVGRFIRSQFHHPSPHETPHA